MWDDIAHSCHDQVSKQGIRWPVSHDLIAGSSFGPLRLHTFLISSADKFLFFNRLQAQHYFFNGHSTWNKFCAYNLESAVELGLELCLAWSHSTSHFYLSLVKIWQVSSCGKFMQHLETCLLIAEADRDLCHLNMFYPFFCTGSTQWNTSAIKNLLLFMAGAFIGFLVEKCAPWQKSNRESSFSKITYS